MSLGRLGISVKWGLLVIAEYGDITIGDIMGYSYIWI
jgi:hypothetical protein